MLEPILANFSSFSVALATSAGLIVGPFVGGYEFGRWAGDSFDLALGTTDRVPPLSTILGVYGGLVGLGLGVGAVIARFTT